MFRCGLRIEGLKDSGAMQVRSLLTWVGAAKEIHVLDHLTNEMQGTFTIEQVGIPVQGSK